MATNNNNEQGGFETNFDDNFGGEVNYPSVTSDNNNNNEQQMVPQPHHHPVGLIASEDQEVSYGDNNTITTEQQVYYTETPTAYDTSNSTSMNISSTTSNERNYVPSLIPEDIRHQYGINALTLDQIHRSIFVSIYSTNNVEISVQELSNFFSFCGSVEKIIMIDDLNGCVVCLDSVESFSTSLLLNEMKLNEQTQLYIFNLCDLLSIPRRKATNQSATNNNNGNQSGAAGSNGHQSGAAGKQQTSDNSQTPPSSLLAVQGLFQEGYIQSKQIFEQLKSKAKHLDEEHDISKKVQHSLNYSKDQWIRFAKQMNDNVENVKLTFVPITTTIGSNISSIGSNISREQLNNQTQQYISYIKNRAKELGNNLNDKIKQQQGKGGELSSKIKDMKIEENLSKAGEAVAKNWTAMTSFIKGQVQKVSASGSGSSSSGGSGSGSSHNTYNNNGGGYSNYGGDYQTTNNYNNNKQLPPLPNKKVVTSLEEDDSMWSSSPSISGAVSGSGGNNNQYSLEVEDDDFPIDSTTTNQQMYPSINNRSANSTTNTTTQPQQQIYPTINNNTSQPSSADSFFD